MPTSEVPTAFEDNAEKFADYGLAVRGFVRYEITHRNLEKLVSGERMRVADIGGGSGIDTLWLAERGHEVTLVEPAHEQVVRARERFSKAPQAIQDRISIETATPDDLVKTESEQFDLVLSHGVAMYMPKPQPFINKLARLLKTDGYISLLEKGYYGKQSHLATTEQWDMLETFDGGMKVNNLGSKAWSFKPNELSDMLERAGVKIVEWSGVRVMSDGMTMPVTDLSAQQRTALLDAEYQQGHHEHLRWGGQMLHFIGQKV